MAKNIARLLKTDMMADFDLKALAQLLQSRGRGGDTILAHITQREADKLAREGGADTINPDTGLPEFYGSDFPSDTAEQTTEPAQPEAAAPVAAVSEPAFTPSNSTQEAVDPAVYAGSYQGPDAYFPAEKSVAQTTAQYPQLYPRATTPTGREATTFGAEGGAPEATAKAPVPQEKQEKGIFEDMTNEQKRNLLLKGALGTGTGIISALQGRRAAKAGEGAKREVQALATPYQQAGQAMQAQAQQGQLTPDRAAQMQAAQAQIAQGIQQRGGVGAQQAATQLAQFRQTLLNDQYNYGLKIAQIGDTYAQKAITTGLTQDKEMSASMQGLTTAMSGFLGGRG
jgi:hypothetical protein